MPIRYTIDRERRTVLTEFTGFTEVDEVLAFWRQLRADPAFAPEFSQLVDLTHADGPGPDPEDMRRLADSQSDPFSSMARRAWVTPVAARFGVIRMYHIVRGDNPNHAVFRTMEEAREWLGLEGA